MFAAVGSYFQMMPSDVHSCLGVWKTASNSLGTDAEGDGSYAVISMMIAG